MEGLSRKLASNDKILENINNRMDSFSSVIKNQHSFNKMIELQIAQPMAAVPPTDKGKIPRQLEDLETANLIDIHNAAYYCIYNHQLECLTRFCSKSLSHVRRFICTIKKHLMPLEDKKYINKIYISAHVYSCVLFMYMNRKGKKVATGLYVVQSHVRGTVPCKKLARATCAHTCTRSELAVVYVRTPVCVLYLCRVVR